MNPVTTVLSEQLCTPIALPIFTRHVRGGSAGFLGPGGHPRVLVCPLVPESTWLEEATLPEGRRGLYREVQPRRGPKSPSRRRPMERYAPSGGTIRGLSCSVPGGGEAVS